MNYFDVSLMDVGARGMGKLLNKIYLFIYQIDFYKFVRDKVKASYGIMLHFRILRC